jgi:hypothetical protein
LIDNNKGWAEKGSQKWLQVLVNKHQDLIDSEITKAAKLLPSDKIVWKSPLVKDGNVEYKDEDFLKALEVKPTKISLSYFWPRSGPRWDGLAKTDQSKMLLLIEAKSHITELISDFKGTNPSSREKILRSLNQTKKRFGVKERYDWTAMFYQYANRLAHLHFLKQNNFEAHLVNIYFLNDEEMCGPKSIDEWKGAIRLMHRCLGLRERLLERLIVDIFVDIRDVNM